MPPVVLTLPLPDGSQDALSCQVNKSRRTNLQQLPLCLSSGFESLLYVFSRPFGLLGEAILFAALLGPRLLLSVLISIHDPVLLVGFSLHLLLLASASSAHFPLDTSN